MYNVTFQTAVLLWVAYVVAEILRFALAAYGMHIHPGLNDPALQFVFRDILQVSAAALLGSWIVAGCSGRKIPGQTAWAVIMLFCVLDILLQGVCYTVWGPRG